MSAHTRVRVGVTTLALAGAAAFMGTAGAQAPPGAAPTAPSRAWCCQADTTADDATVPPVLGLFGASPPKSGLVGMGCTGISRAGGHTLADCADKGHVGLVCTHGVGGGVAVTGCRRIRH